MCFQQLEMQAASLPAENVNLLVFRYKNEDI